MSKKIVFMGTPKFSVQTLKELINSNLEIECVYSQPPSKSSRGQKLKISPVQELAEKFKLNFRSPITLDEEKEFNFFKTLESHIIIVVAYGKLIPKKYLDLEGKFFLNIHASLLPKWRGAAPIQRSIMNQDKETGISFMKIVEKLDAGPYMRQLKVKLEKQTTSKMLNEKLSELGAKNIIECINLIISNKAEFTEQEETKATYAKKITKEEAKINWKETAENVLAKINSFNPTPGAWFEFENKRYKIWKAEISELTDKPGKIINEKLVIACKSKSIKILEIQKEGKSKLMVNDFIAGSKIHKGRQIL
ncbi:methionyl-tRNA formyltransferase [Pelagibacteraceae bacterium]|jgi:methionyl-tRNA formyltransferase|nr:methionyl-tRNA formyltransferase [Pelagibacteraceae bacterium]|tara:strand:+ start:326 stop:1246 length:921 start_codon:yes stop_codon:yes gene_type:complete